VILDEFRYYIDKSQFQFLCFVSDEASSWNFHHGAGLNEW
jgi:hypothetical protein